MARKSGIGKFIAGAAVGVGLGVLFAPKSGKETRTELKEKCDELIKKIKELDVAEVRDSLVAKVEEIKKEISELDREKVGAIAKEKAIALKNKTEELYREAKEKATPVVQKAAAELKDKVSSLFNKEEKEEKAGKKVASKK